jgi:hypothetical protein
MSKPTIVALKRRPEAQEPTEAPVAEQAFLVKGMQSSSTPLAKYSNDA